MYDASRAVLFRDLRSELQIFTSLRLAKETRKQIGKSFLKRASVSLLWSSCWTRVARAFGRPLVSKLQSCDSSCTVDEAETMLLNLTTSIKSTTCANMKKENFNTFNSVTGLVYAWCSGGCSACCLCLQPGSW